MGFINLLEKYLIKVVYYVEVLVSYGKKFFGEVADNSIFEEPK